MFLCIADKTDKKTQKAKEKVKRAERMASALNRITGNLLRLCFVPCNYRRGRRSFVCIRRSKMWKKLS